MFFRFWACYFSVVRFGQDKKTGVEGYRTASRTRIIYVVRMIYATVPVPAFCFWRSLSGHPALILFGRRYLYCSAPCSISFSCSLYGDVYIRFFNREGELDFSTLSLWLLFGETTLYVVSCVRISYCKKTHFIFFITAPFARYLHYS